MTSIERDSKLINGLQCGLDAFLCNYKTGKATLYLPEGECCDMRGTIAFVMHHFPSAKLIETVSGDKLDTVYRHRETGEWAARRPKS
ncbi:hypothetical protein QTI17_17240 [Variovorax sp. J31P179]|uniref:hypothetical protein n=1 Tax=Variovorax sp. J31P179 TaxID=3053508 RepID=UPI002576A9CD|nr:hypothetical protein [Variovorax sp. J31P179]MDM0082340.1 hypothetical protein [Variovorax sp. J31P179]